MGNHAHVNTAGVQRYRPASRNGGGALNDRLDEDKINQLRRWGSGLAKAENDELRATGKAILLLIEEIEALHVDLWNAKSAAVDAPAGEDEEAEERDVHRT